MKIVEIEIEGFKILQSNHVIFDRPQIYPEGGQTIGLIGRNGSGKTTICSMIALIFQAIYSCRKTNFNINLAFEHCKKTKRIICKDNEVTLLVEGEDFYKFKLGTKLRSDARKMHDEKVYNFWNGKIILSTFEINGEYPSKRHNGYEGITPLFKYDIADIYGKNIFGFPSITTGLLRMITEREKLNIVRSFLKEMNIDLLDEIEIKIVRSVIEEEEQAQQIREILNKSQIGKLLNENETELSELANRIKADTRLEYTSAPQIISIENTISITKDYEEFIGNHIFINGFKIKKDQKILGFQNLSSGEKFLIIRFLSILSGINENSIVIIEEPENHLNPAWRELIIPSIHKITTAYNSTLIFTTHDHRVIKFLHNNCVYKVTNGHITKVDQPTLMADEFDFESIGEKTIPFVYKELEEVFNRSSREKKALLLKGICEVKEKGSLRNKFLEKNAKN